MKKCPACNRTYSDETLSFCLEDGSLLSAPYDFYEGQETVVRNNPKEHSSAQYFPSSSEYHETPTKVSSKKANLNYSQPSNAQNIQERQGNNNSLAFSTGKSFAPFWSRTFLSILLISILGAIYTASIVPLGFGLIAILIYLVWIITKRK